ncbi:hypothetical protein F5Y00DRAFT_232248 [Daldinia vernicosa]|uniref:uncharacterized protein n=1 Tax=Daldinia vernicosa TaxID=114800 RepID=UPI00200815A4|nr:uncharacterized protein F5Y00DRAFT_232248 [Daldinia vernicosa]KAI0850870.1 hypothetical protein F5Y00DRAFT_232248 [Daldinia vernicosa]
MVASKAGPQLPKALQQSTDDLEDRQDDDNEPIDRSIYKDGRGDFRGFYHDGAYIAYPPGYFDKDEDEEEDEDEDENEDEYYDEDYNGEEGGEQEDPELGYDDASDYESSEGGPRNSNSDEIYEAYFLSLTKRFLALRQVLLVDPPDHLLYYNLPRSNPTEVGEFGPKSDTFAKWSGRLRGTDPLPAQIAGMHKDGVIRLIRIILGGKFLRKNQELRERTSRWIWALLARLPERGELDYQEIGWIRELGKRAVLLMVSLAEMEVLKEHYDVGDSNAGSQGEVEVDEGIDGTSQVECCDYEDIDIDVNDPEPHYRGPGQPPGGRVPKLAPFNGTIKIESDTDTNTPNGKEPVGTEVPSEEIKPELSDVEMEIDSQDEEEEDGEVSDAPQQQTEPTADIERAKARLLEQLNSTAADENGDSPAEELPATALEEEAFLALAAEEEEAKTEQLRRAKVNERATLNMILTVAGEFYGQRDLLEFRDPFGGIQVE